jgi:hypothetical protein
MSDFTENTDSLEADASFEQPLRRVAYEAGMLLGLEATRDEQAYHRRRLNRHQYWLEGYGTLAGMRVGIDPLPDAGVTAPIPVKVLVGQGVGIDGLGREVLIREPYGIDLADWIRAQGATRLYTGYNDTTNVLHLKVTVRHQEVPVGMQPVLARKLNLSTDAVQPSRTVDSILLELIPELPPTSAETRFNPWAAHDPIVDAMPAGLTGIESDYLETITAPDTSARAQLELHARLLHCLDDKGISAQLAADELEEGARLLLARIEIDIPDLDTLLENAKEGKPLVNPNNIRVNNLVRPFLVTASQLGYLLANS